ncbi:hypothetical protein LXA43DRAFT_850346, partial [Ganoderma leucocontextum]
VDQSANPVTLTNPDGSSQYTLPAQFRLYAEHDLDVRAGRVDHPVPGGYLDFSGRWNQDQNCPWRFSTYDPASKTVTVVGAPFPAGFLDMIDPPPVQRPRTPPAIFEFSTGQNDIIQHMLWSTARRESFLERKREAARTKKVEDRHTRREEYRARDAAMGQPRTNTTKKNAAARPLTNSEIVTIAFGRGPRVSAAAAAVAAEPAA